MPTNLARTAALSAAALFLIPAAFAQAPQTLLATPTTVAWGYYSAQAKPVLTIKSGDTVKVQTLSTCGPPERLKTLASPPPTSPHTSTTSTKIIPPQKRVPAATSSPAPSPSPKPNPATSSKSASRKSTSTSPGPATHSAPVAASSPTTSPTANPASSPSTAKR